MSRLVYTAVFTMASLLAGIATGSAQQTPPNSDEAIGIVTLVDKAVAFIDTKGRAAFTQMKQNPGEWRKGDAYLFASDMNGVSLLNMGFPKFEGNDTIGLKDSTGKFIVQEQIALVKSKGAGWVSYMWPKAGQTTPLKKWSYVKAISVDGKAGYVGAGFYPK